MLELVDDEFIRTRNDLDSYASAVQKSIDNKDLQLGLDLDSVGSYINSPTVARLDHEISRKSTRELTSKYETVDKRLEELKHLHYKTLAEVEYDLQRFGSAIVKLCTRQLNEWTTEDRDPSQRKIVVEGISLFYLYLLRVAENYDPQNPEAFSSGVSRILKPRFIEEARRLLADGTH